MSSLRRRTLEGSCTALLAAWTLAGCQSTVLLGGECPTREACVGDGDRTGDGDGSAGEDASVGDGDRSGDGDGAPSEAGVDADVSGDAGDGDMVTPADAGAPDAAHTPMPDILNRSFERTEGEGSGDINGPLAPAKADPWYHCLPPVQTQYLRLEQNTDGVKPSDGNYFFAFGYPAWVMLPIPIYQHLQTPIRAGQRYAFLIDVQAISAGTDDRLGLEVWGGNTHCLTTTTLATTPYQKNSEWITQCVAFTAQDDLTEIALVPKNLNGIAVTDRLFLDNIRSDPSCQ
jgi:hypothetical protein